MGVDAVIECRTTDGKEPDLWGWLPSSYSVSEERDEYTLENEGATHSIESCDRYYGKEYARGDWPRICLVLLELLAAKNVDKVWYHGDTDWGGPEITIEGVADLCRYFVEHGNGPYRDRPFNIAGEEVV